MNTRYLQNVFCCPGLALQEETQDWLVWDTMVKKHKPRRWTYGLDPLPGSQNASQRAAKKPNVPEHQLQQSPQIQKQTLSRTREGKQEVQCPAAFASRSIQPTSSWTAKRTTFLWSPTGWTGQRSSGGPLELCLHIETWLPCSKNWSIWLCFCLVSFYTVI